MPPHTQQKQSQGFFRIKHGNFHEALVGNNNKGEVAISAMNNHEKQSMPSQEHPCNAVIKSKA